MPYTQTQGAGCISLCPMSILSEQHPHCVQTQRANIHAPSGGIPHAEQQSCHKCINCFMCSTGCLHLSHCSAVRRSDQADPITRAQLCAAHGLKSPRWSSTLDMAFALVKVVPRWSTALDTEVHVTQMRTCVYVVERDCMEFS